MHTVEAIWTVSAIICLFLALLDIGRGEKAGSFLDLLDLPCPFNITDFTTIPMHANSLSNDENIKIDMIPSWLIKITDETYAMCRYFDSNKAFGQFKLDKRRVHFINNDFGPKLTVNTSPFVTSGSFEAISSLVLGRNNGAPDSEIPSSALEKLSHSKRWVVQIRGDSAWHNLLLLAECVKTSKSIERVVVIIDHSDLGFPSGSIASSTGNTMKELKKSNEQWSQFPLSKWHFFVSNYDDYTATTASFITPIPLGLTTASWIREQLYGLCHTVSQFKQQPKNPKHWLFVSMSLENNHDERTAALNAAKKVATQAPPGAVKIAGKESFNDTLASMMDFKFVLAPAGRGLDSHRVLEVLMLGRIPIVRWTPNVCAYEGLPVLRVRGWQDLTWEILQDAWHRLQSNVSSYQTNKLFMPYWKQKVLSKLEHEE